MMNDTALLEQISAGDQTAFKILFERHRSKLYNYLVRITKSKEVAEEIVIDVFLKLWLGRDLIVEIKNIEGFLHKVACNKALDFLRMASRDKRLQALLNKQAEIGKGSSSDQTILENECQDLLQKALQELSPQRRLVFTLSRDHGLSHEEIAAKLNLSRNTVRNTIAEGMKLIRQFLKKHYYNAIIPFSLF